MLNYPRLFVILAFVYGSVFLLAISYSNQRSTTQKVDLKSSSAFLDDIPVEKEITTPQYTLGPVTNPLKELANPIKVFRSSAVPAVSEPVVPAVKLNPFELLGAYPDSKAYTGAAYNTPHYGLINDDNYCYETDWYNLEHPENMFEKMNFFTDVKQDNMMRHKVLNKIGTLYMTKVDKMMSAKMSQLRTYHIDKEINDFVLFSYPFPMWHKIGKHYLCATQMTNHIPNVTSIISKERMKQTVEDFSLKYKNKPQCFDKTTFYPLTYRLFDKNECQEFFGIINSEEYAESLKTEPLQYIIKLGSGTHKASGVFLLDTNQTKLIHKDYDSGKLCGTVKKPWIAQKYIANPLLLDNNNKFHIRVYLLITSTNPLIVYQQDGYIRASISVYDKHSEDRASHLTNVLVDEFAQARKENRTINGMTPDELDDYGIWSYNDLQNYLLEIGKINDTNWVDNYLRPSIQRAFVHLVRMSSAYYWKQSNVYELLGCDFILDDDLNVWFLEANTSPQVDGVQDDLISAMLFDLFEVQYSYFRSRMKRVVDVIQRMQKENGTGEVKDLEKWKGLYQEAVKNRLEPEYMIKETNTFRKIVDESLPGVKAYFGLVTEECLNP